MISTASVQTLTAEVRVLMVGSRQVTLSVAKQLDVVELGDLKPFGRVRLNDGVWVIGADGAGVLSLARGEPEPKIQRAIEKASRERDMWDLQRLFGRGEAGRVAYDAYDAAFRAVQDLPLIVLAGLK